MNELKEKLLPLRERNPYKIIYAPLTEGDTAQCRMKPAESHLQWQKIHCHKHYCRELLYVISGSCITFAGNDFFHCPAGTLQFFPGNTPHNSLYYPGSSGVHIWAKLQAMHMTCFIYEILSSMPEVTSTVIYSYSFSEENIIKKLNNVLDEVQQGNTENTAELEALCRLIFISLCRNLNPANDPQREMMINIRKMLSCNCGRDMDLEYLAGLAGCSKQHFMRKFKEINGCTTREVVKAARLKELDEIPPGMLTKELADKLGFDSPAAFCHWRKKHFPPTNK